MLWLHQLLKSMAVVCGCLRNWFRRKRAGNRGDDDGGENTDNETSSLFFELRSLEFATNFFSDLNKLGHGGFGPVYKGLMPNGQEIAVKKLSQNSRQGVREFTNEVMLLLKIQHKNLVVLYGCCVEGPEKMLIYEYLPNKSLDYFLFSKSQSMTLDWPTRYKIIVGVARGLLYLHEEARERIIHRDIKASNILLDDSLNPKISDFGLARLFPGEDTHLDTFKISGTYGYMAPEYAMRGYLSVKADVFSFGVLVLEIVSGRKNQDKQLGPVKADLLRYTWQLFQEGNTKELVDPSLDKYNSNEVAMCIHLGLLCCQANVSERPTMSSVNIMISSESFSLPRPGVPGLQGRTGRYSATTTSLNDANSNTNTNTNTRTSTNTSYDANTSTNIITDPTASSLCNGTTRTTAANSFVEEYSRNFMSISSMDEGR